MQTSLIEDHDNFGWWVFAGTLVPLYFLARWLELGDDKAAQGMVADKGASGAAGMGSPVMGVVGVLVLVVATWWALPERSALITEEPGGFNVDLSDQYAPVFGGQLAGWRPQIRNPDRVYAQTLFNREQVIATESVDQMYYLGLFTYEFQRHRAELIQYSNRLYDRENWIPERFFDVDAGLAGNVRGITLKNRMTGQQVTLGYVYLVQGRWETDQWRAKLAQVSGFFNDRDDASLLIAAVSCTACDPQASLTEFVRTAFPAALEQVSRLVAQ